MISSKKTETPLVSLDSAGLYKEVPVIEVIIEIPQGSFLKRDSTGKLDFVSPFPCPFNYGSVPAFIGLDGDLLDAVVLGDRLPLGSTVTVPVWGAVRMIDQGSYDDKLICGHSPISPWKRPLILLFFRIYAKCKHLLNLIRGRKGCNRCEGWHEAEDALAKATPRVHVKKKGPTSHD